MKNQRPKPRYFMQDDDQAIHREPPRHLQLRVRSFTEPTPHCTADSTDRLVQTAQEPSFIEDSEDEIPVILSSISTSMPRFSSIYNSFHSSLETSHLLVNQHCDEEFQMHNENFNPQDFAVMSQLSYRHECNMSQPIMISNDDSDVILINLTIDQDEHEHEEYDYEGERNISIESDSTEEFDKGNILLGLESAKILAPKVEVDFSQEPNDDEILECSTQYGEEDDAIVVESDNMNVTLEVEGQQSEKLAEGERAKVEPTIIEDSEQSKISSNYIHETENEEILVESFPGEIKIVKRSPKKEDEKESLRAGMTEDNRVNKSQRKELRSQLDESYQNNSELKNEKEIEIPNDQILTSSCLDSNEEPNHDSKKTLKNSISENYTPPATNNSSVSLQNLHNSTPKTIAVNVKQNTNGKRAKENVKKSVKCDNEHVSKDITKLSNHSKSVPTKSSATETATSNLSHSKTASNKENIDAVRVNRKIVRKRIASKPLSEICNQHPRSRVGLSKRVKIDPLHQKLKNK